MSLLPCGWGVAGVVVVAKVVAVTTKGLFVPAKVVTAAGKCSAKQDRDVIGDVKCLL